MSFKSRLVIFTSIWFCFALVGIGMTYHWHTENTELRTKQSLHKDLAIHMRDDNPLMIGTDYNPKALKSIFHTLMLIGPDFEIYFLDSQGNITTHAAPENTDLMGQVDLAPIKQFLSGQAFPILGNDPRNDGENKVFSVAAIKELGSTVGYLYVVIGSSRHSAIASVNSVITTPYFVLAGLILITILGFALGTYWIVKKCLLNPIQIVTEKLQQQAEHEFQLSPDFTHQVPELVPIAQSYQLMAKHIQQQFLLLEYQATARKQSLFQLSHDLKTPLASVLGYLETWRIQQGKGDALIEVAYRNSNKLLHQLESLLDTAKQETVMPSYEYQTVVLQPLLTECSEMLRSQFQRRNITLSVAIEPELQVIGNKGLLERLFLNLLENALRHSPSGSTVECRVSTEINQSNNGKIQFVFSNAIDHRAPSGSLGIGTKIVKSILMLHYSVLNTSVTEERYQQAFSLNMAV
ncbi:HAMP domain-containing sensor histidine kinase [Vibrio sp. FNV 38]|nr:HAMP domain-containing sensor histidine kinase [Vibrio sp. FNV 38]